MVFCIDNSEKIPASKKHSFKSFSISCTDLINFDGIVCLPDSSVMQFFEAAERILYSRQDLFLFFWMQEKAGSVKKARKSIN